MWLGWARYWQLFLIVVTSTRSPAQFCRENANSRQVRRRRTHTHTHAQRTSGSVAEEEAAIFCRREFVPCARPQIDVTRL